MVYQPMLELMDALAARGFTNCIVTGGGTEFVRAVSEQIYGVAQERVVGTLVTYQFDRRDGRVGLLRTTSVRGEANEGAAKVDNIQVALGRRPTVAGGNSPGDAEMLEYTSTGDGPRLSLLVNHDDAEREYAYESEAGTFAATSRSPTPPRGSAGPRSACATTGRRSSRTSDEQIRAGRRRSRRSTSGIRIRRR